MNGKRTDASICAETVPPPRDALPITDFRNVLTVHDPEAGFRQVYFMYCAGFIKIGTARSIIRRATELQIGSPWKSQVVLLIPGGRLREAFLHFAFQDHHAGGEWFHLSPVIREAIRELAPPECLQWLAEEERDYRDWITLEAARLGIVPLPNPEPRS